MESPRPLTTAELAEQLSFSFISQGPSSLDLFRQAAKVHGLEFIATQIGLHRNTVVRWQDTARVPVAYVPDLRRMLNMRGDHGVAKDQYFTRPETARKCFSLFKDKMRRLGVDISRYTFIEPSMGEGCFFDLFPERRRIGIDIEPTRSETIEHDYLLWEPGKGDKRKFLIVGNPPFGLRGHLALQFLNHSAAFADAVGFILPQCFGSDGKGAPGKRVKGYRLAMTEDLRGDHFYRPNGAPVSINTVFQVWTKVGWEHLPVPQVKSCNTFIKVLSVSDGGTPASTRNKAWIGKCDLYLPSTTYSGMRAYPSFDELPNRRGYGVVIHTQKREIKHLLQRHDWMKTAFPSTNSAVNLRKSMIEDVVIAAGFVDR